MKLALVSTEFKNGDLEYNYQKIISKAQEAKEQDAEMVCFGESFLQGFDGLTWDYEQDKDIAITINDKYIRNISEFARENQIAIAFGLYLREGKNIYSTYLIIDKQGVITDEYRRITKGWKPKELQDSPNSKYYKEGFLIYNVAYQGLSICCTLCGDLWDDYVLEKIIKLKPDLVLWPVYVNYSKADWQKEEKEYLRRMSKVKTKVAMINSLTTINSPAKTEEQGMQSLGGCLFINKTINSKIKFPFGKDGILYVEA